MAELKISDLSVGDLVLNKKGFPTKVQVITSEGNMRCGEDAKPEHSVHIWITDVSPIPITPEILEKNGFRKNGKYNEWNIGEWNENPFIGVSLDRQSLRVRHFDNDIFIEDKVLFVHQLQHALRLAGVEKEIEV
ncbi:MAG: hypothetical protein IKK89_05905 [Alistipes sp.]|nr:hypothetical protein [Alistipes sp.]MBR6631462.1 hypothetical protein [Alistipes sp.]